MKRFPSIISGVTMATVLAIGMPTSVAAQRQQGGGGPRTSGGGGGDRAVPRGGGDSGGGTASAPRPVSGGSAAAPQRGSEAERSGERAQPSSRQRGGQAPADVAVARRGPRPSINRPIFIDRGYYRGYYPWGYGGYGFGGYYGGYYDPWFYGSGYSAIAVGGDTAVWRRPSTRRLLLGFRGRFASYQGEAAERVSLRGRLLRRAGGRFRRSLPALARGAGTASHRGSGRRVRATLLRDSRASGPYCELQRRAQTATGVISRNSET